MADVKAVFDTNILIDHLIGVDEARNELMRFSERAVSIVTWAEVLVGSSAAHEARTKDFLDLFSVVPLETAVAEQAVALRREHRIRLPDAIIWATARASGALLVTRNTKNFPANDPGIRVPYQR